MLRSCDTMVALGPTTASGQTLFAKNSDRPARECQPLVLEPRRLHGAGDVTRCQFVTLPEAPVTCRHVGSRPYWCWGYEHGFNEHQVVIGNEGLGSKVRHSEPNLIGMEVLRLGLERGRTAAEAVEVMTDAITRFGQGIVDGATHAGNYDNGYLVADPREAYVLETAGHHWAVKRVEGAVGISNVYSIGADWDRLSPDAEEYAAGQGWWSSDRGRPDFGGAFGQEGYGQEGLGCGARRRARACTVLHREAGRIDARTLMALLSDHSDGSAPDEPFRTGIQPGGICYHSTGEELGWCGNTAASLVADLCADGTRLPIYWCSFYSPCLGVFLPIFIEGELPPALSLCGPEPDEESAWWTFHRLSYAAVAGGEHAIGRVRERWSGFQESLFTAAQEMAREGRSILDRGGPDAASEMLTRCMDGAVSSALRTARELLASMHVRGAANQGDDR